MGEQNLVWGRKTLPGEENLVWRRKTLPGGGEPSLGE
jgi:hypothetical protein